MARTQVCFTSCERVCEKQQLFGYENETGPHPFSQTVSNQLLSASPFLSHGLLFAAVVQYRSAH